ncbi:GNAT family N-acetyltransferase [Kordiimonas aquimaris]|uniref:GNAT family N-acetyltransferase n=1 Tax=Kordiimonas aquimaris TaxID=707591 RepID=UPI0021D12DA2|nr:GNAT family N-acetyltransferase [Kordiimonas aquimaris]
MLKIRPYKPTDWPDVERVYAEGIATNLATFETKPKQQASWETDSINGSRFVCLDNTADTLPIMGWATLWPVSDRCAYAGVAEISVYVSADARGKGVGTVLLNKLVTASEQLNIWTLQAGIFAENTPSILLHEKCGFRRIGIREKLGALHGEWKDIMLMERRSKTVGI